MKIRIGNKPFTSIDDLDQLMTNLVQAFSEELKIVLENEQGESIWALGSEEKLIMGYENSEGGKMFSLSKRDQSIVPVIIAKATLEVQKNDLMMGEDAKMLFTCFFKEQPFPDAYNLRIR